MTTGPIPLPDYTSRRWASETALLLSATIFRNLAQIAILWLLATLADQATVGRYALVLAITTPAFTVAQLGVRGVYLTHAKPIALRSYVLVQLVFIATAFVLSVGIAAAFSPDLVLLAGAAAAAKAADALAEPFSGVLQRYGRSVLILAGNAVVAIAGGGAVAIALATTRQIDPSIAAFAAVNIIATATVIVMPAIRIARVREADERTAPGGMLTFAASWRHIIAAGLPLGAANGLLSLILSAPQFVLAATGGDAAVGHLATLVYSYAVADVVAGTLTLTWIPRAQRLLRDPSPRPFLLTRTALAAAGRWTLAFVPLTAIGLVLVWFLFPVVFGREYALTASSALALGVTIVLLPIPNFLGISTLVSNQYAHSLSFSIAGALTAAAASLLLVPSYGLVGALWSICIANAVRAIVALWVLYRGERRRQDRVANG